MKEELSDREKKIFQSLPKDKIPPAALEKNIIKELKSEGLIKPGNTMKKVLQWAAVVAAVVGAYFIGDYSPPQDSYNYMIILQEDDNFQPGDPMVMFTEYRDWMIAMNQKGVQITGQELRNESVLVSPTEDPLYSDGESGPKVTGYFIFSASSMDEAIEVAKESPHTRYGGTIQVKEYMIR